MKIGLIERASSYFMSITKNNKKLSYCWDTVMRSESMPRIAEMDVEITT